MYITGLYVCNELGIKKYHMVFRYFLSDSVFKNFEIQRCFFWHRLWQSDLFFIILTVLNSFHLTKNSKQVLRIRFGVQGLIHSIPIPIPIHSSTLKRNTHLKNSFHHSFHPIILLKCDFGKKQGNRFH